MEKSNCKHYWRMLPPIEALELYNTLSVQECMECGTIEKKEEKEDKIIKRERERDGAGEKQVVIPEKDIRTRR